MVLIFEINFTFKVIFIIQDFYLLRKRLFAGGPPANKNLFAGGPPANKNLFAGGPPANKKLFAGGPPANKTLFARTPSVLCSSEWSCTALFSII